MQCQCHAAHTAVLWCNVCVAPAAKDLKDPDLLKKRAAKFGKVVAPSSNADDDARKKVGASAERLGMVNCGSKSCAKQCLVGA